MTDFLSRFTARLRQVMKTAGAVAKTRNAEVSEIEFFHGFIVGDYGVGKALLARKGVELSEHWRQSPPDCGSLIKDLSAEGKTPIDARAVVRAMIEEARLSDNRHVGTEHLLLAFIALKEENSLVGRWLDANGLTLVGLRADLQQYQQEFSTMDGNAKTN